MALDRSIEPANIKLADTDFNKSFNQLNFLKNNTQYLGNGLPMQLIQAGTQDILKVDIILNAGQWHQERPLQASFTASLLREGTKKQTAAEIAEQIDFHGAFLQTDTERDNAVVSLFCLSKHLSKILPIIRDLLTQAIFPENEFETIRRKNKQDFLVNSSKVMSVARRHFNPLIFSSEHPYGAMACTEDFDNIEVDALNQFYQKHYQNAPFRIIVSGKPANDSLKVIDEILGSIDIKRQRNIENQYTDLQHPKPERLDIKAGNGLQSAIRIGRIMFNRTHPDYFKVSVLNTVLGGYFGSRLMTNIREEKGLTYGIGSGLASFRHNGVFFISTEVNAEQKNQAIDEIMKEINVLRTEAVSYDELMLVKNYTLGQFMRSLDGPFALAERLRILSDFNLDAAYYTNFLQTIKDIKAEDLTEMANKYFKEEDLSILTVG